MLKSKYPFLAITVVFLLFISPISVPAQRRPATPRKPPAPASIVEPAITFDTLLADDHYRIYSEMRNVGTLVRSQGFNELLEPLVKLAEPPKQFATVLKWIGAHADSLAGSRLCVASWPSKNNLPTFLFAIELASVEEAKKFEAELRTFLPKLDPKPSPSPSPSPATDGVVPNPPQKAATFAQLQIKQVGALILLTEKPVSLLDLKPRGSRLLAENPNFAVARNRFAAESLFLYVDFKAIEKEEKNQRQKWQEEEKRRQAAAEANPPSEPMLEASPDPAEDEIASSSAGELQPPAAAEPIDESAAASSASQRSQAEMAESFNSILGPISMALAAGRAKYPEAVGAGLAFEGDSYLLRVLVVNSAENRSLPLPFMPQIASGPVLTPASANVLPSDVDLYVVLSLDYPQMYEGIVKAFSEQPWLAVQGPNAIGRPASPFSAFEAKVGIKVKEELLPLLGNEIAFILPKPPNANDQTAREADPPDTEDRKSVRLPELMPVIALSLKDREAVKRLIPKMFESMGLKGAGMLAQSEKRGDTEIISYANMFAYGFIGDFLIFSPDIALTRRVVDSYLNGESLSGNGRFRNATRWQSRQVQGQVYLGPDLVEKFMFGERGKTQNVSLTNQPVEPLTYMLSTEGLGPLHEVHVPRSLLMMVVAGISSKANESPIVTNESIAKNVLRTLAAAQNTFRETEGNGRYASLDELLTQGLLSRDMLENYGYTIGLSVLSNRWEGTAAPLEYGKTGRRSFYIDDSGILRGGDHGGGAATLSDQPVNE